MALVRLVPASKYTSDSSSSPTNPCQDATHRALAINEVLSRVFQLNDRHTNTVCARVNHAWSELALDELWHSMTYLLALFRVLAPLHLVLGQQSVTEFAFTQELMLRDWQRFYFYAKRVKKLAFSSTTMTRVTVQGQPELMASCDRIFTELALTKPQEYLLPTLQSLACVLDHHSRWTHYIRLFFSDNLRSLSITMPSGLSREKCAHILEAIGQKTPNLSVLGLFFQSPAMEFDAEIARLLPQLTQLRSLHLSSCILSMPKTLIAAASLPLLDKIALASKSSPGFKEEMFRRSLQSTGSAAPVVPKWTSDIVPFQGLTRLTIHNTFKAAVAILQSTIAPANLVNLEIVSVPGLTSQDTTQLLGLISLNCTSLRKLRLQRADEKAMNDANTVVSPSTIRCITGLRFLTFLSIVDDASIVFTDVTLVAFLSGLPHLQRLELPNGASTFLHSGLTPNALPLIARACPQLIGLSLLINGVRFKERHPDSSSSESIVSTRMPFSKLRYITFGISPITATDVGPLSFFLSKILPSNCAMDTNPFANILRTDARLLRFERVRPRESGSLAACHGSWVQVRKMLSLLVQARMDERRKMGEM